jgi:hypothetical protein
MHRVPFTCHTSQKHQNLVPNNHTSAKQRPCLAPSAALHSCRQSGEHLVRGRRWRPVGHRINTAGKMAALEVWDARTSQVVALGVEVPSLATCPRKAGATALPRENISGWTRAPGRRAVGWQRDPDGVKRGTRREVELALAEAGRRARPRRLPCRRSPAGPGHLYNAPQLIYK